MSKFGAVQVGYGFEALKNNGKRYAGDIVRVAAHPRGTLVTIRFAEPMENDGQMYSVGEMPVSYRSIYLEECAEWYTEEPAPY